MDDEGNVVRLRGRVFGHETRAGDYVGVMALGARIVAEIPEQGCLMADVALPHLAAGRRVLTIVSPAAWTDLGDLQQYVAANFAWLDAHLAARPQSSTLNPRCWVAEDALIPPSATLDRCLIGGRVTVTGGGRLVEVIAWPGATVVAPLSRAVVLTSGRVVRFDESA
jgi:NDP-sugar pyrophosphorylase family protein